MSVGFGFSVGDFIAAIELVGTVIDALRSSGSASTEYRELVSQLLSLETALLQVKRLEFEEQQYAEVIALRQAAAQCQRTIDAFWKKAQKYQPSLSCEVNGGIGTKSEIKRGLMKIQWAICRKGDVEKFKADLRGHTESIQLLLATVQMGKSTIHEKRQEEQQKSMAGRVQEGYFNCMQRLAAVVDQGKQLLDMTASILQTNVKVFQIVLQIQQFVTRIPGQVERQQPVYLLDALGKSSPFHLGFVRSAEALVAVLKINFKKHGRGTQMIERGDFVIQDSTTKRDIDLKADWEVCFFPGQRVDMSMVFTLLTNMASQRNCPKCYNPSPGKSDNIDIECGNCGMTFRVLQNLPSILPKTDTNLDTVSNIVDFTIDKTYQPLQDDLRWEPSKRKRLNDCADFRRVRLRRSVFEDEKAGSTPPSSHSKHASSAYPKPNRSGFDFYCNEMHPVIVAQNQSSTADGTFDVDRLLEAGWKNLGVNQREDYESQFRNLMRQIEAERDIDRLRHIPNSPVGRLKAPKKVHSFNSTSSRVYDPDSPRFSDSTEQPDRRVRREAIGNRAAKINPLRETSSLAGSGTTRSSRDTEYKSADSQKYMSTRERRAPIPRSNDGGVRYYNSRSEAVNGGPFRR